MDLIESTASDVAKLRREWAAFEEDAERILASVERKRSQARASQQRAEKGQNGAQQPLAFEPGMTREQQLAVVKQRLQGR